MAAIYLIGVYSFNGVMEWWSTGVMKIMGIGKC